MNSKTNESMIRYIKSAAEQGRKCEVVYNKYSYHNSPTITVIGRIIPYFVAGTITVIWNETDTSQTCVSIPLSKIVSVRMV